MPHVEVEGGAKNGTDADGDVVMQPVVGGVAMSRPVAKWYDKWTQEIDLTKALFSGLIDKHVIGTEKAATDDMLDVIYGDTDSAMSAVPKSVLRGMSRSDVVRFATFVSEMVCTLINRYLEGLELLQAEKIASLMLLPGMKKNYIMILTMGKILLSGIEGKKRDSHPIIRELTQNVVPQYMMDTDVPIEQLEQQLTDMIEKTKEVLNTMVTGKIPHSQMVMTEKLNKATYVNPKEITVVRDKRIARHEEVNVGDRITYVLADLDPKDPAQRAQIRAMGGRRRKHVKNMDMAECARYAAEMGVPLNYEETFYRKIAGPILKLYRPFIVPITDFPNAEHLLAEGIAPDSKQGKDLIKKRRQAVFDYQDTIAAPMIFGQLEEQFDRRRRIRHRQIEYEDDEAERQGDASARKRPRTLMSFFSVQNAVRSRERICTNCNDIFFGERDVCGDCLSNLDQITLDVYAQYKTDKETMADSYRKCHVCLADTGFPELDADDCVDLDCPVYEQRFGLKYDIKAAKTKVEQFQRSGACPGRTFEW